MGSDGYFHDKLWWMLHMYSFNPTSLFPKSLTLRWRHNDYDCGSYYQPHGCLLKRLFRRKSKKTSKLRVTGLCVGNSPGPVNSPHKEPVTRKMFPFDDVIMKIYLLTWWKLAPYKTTRDWHQSYLLTISLLFQGANPTFCDVTIGRTQLWGWWWGGVGWWWGGG